MQFNQITDPDHKTKIDKFREEIDSYVEWIFKHHQDNSRGKSKVIHDGVWGTHRFDKHEIAVINTPLLQRLRQIHQTAHTYLTYPSTQHSRFEHTLGVTAQVGNLFKALKERFQNDSSGKEGLIDDGFYRSLRMAALLHDSGHGPLSHTSEEIYKDYEEFKILKKYNPFTSAKAHEILSYLIVDSSRFKRFLEQIKRDHSLDFDEELTKNAIVKHSRSPLEHYKIDMLSGPFDADKLDYLFRDGHFSGLPLQIDLDRLWYSIDIHNVKDYRRLTIDWGGVSSLEQIIFSKMTLFPSVYHHHKVRACDCMFKGIIEYIRDNGINFRKEGLTIDFSRAIHFLYFTDPEVFGMHGRSREDKGLHDLLHNLQFRRLLKRAIVISRDTIKKDKINNLDEYTKYREKPVIKDGMEYYRWLAKQIWKEAGKPCLLQELWVDCPKDPTFDEVNDTWISPLKTGLDPTPLSEFFRADQYADQYKHKKWRSHVFCRPEHLEAVAKASKKVFKNVYDIEFEPIAFHLCHIDPP